MHAPPSQLGNWKLGLTVTVIFVIGAAVIFPLLKKYTTSLTYYSEDNKPKRERWRNTRVLQKESSIDPTSIKQLYTRMLDMFSGRIPRIFAINPDNSLKEMIGKRLEYADTYLLCNLDKNEMYILLYNPSMDVWRRRAIYKVASELNSSMFRSAMRIKTIEDIKEMVRILEILNIEIAPV